MQQLLATAILALAAIVIAGSLPLLFAKVPPNRWYGARFREAFASPGRWYDINAHAARLLIAWGGVMGGIAIASQVLPAGQRPWVVVVLASTPLLLVLPALQSLAYARHTSGQ